MSLSLKGWEKGLVALKLEPDSGPRWRTPSHQDRELTI